MALPKEPRQKMINLMYLVLTALLALNVSAEILNAFKTVERSLTTTNTTINASTQTIMASFEEKLKEPESREKAAIWKPKADQAVALTKGLNDYINGLKAEILKAAEFNPTKENGFDSSFKEDNQDIATRLMVEQGKGKELYKKLQEYKAAIAKIEPSLSVKVNELLKQIDLSVPPTKNKANDTWEAVYFRMVPTVAATTMLSKFQNDVKTTENRIVSLFHEQVGQVKVRYNQFAAIVGQNSNYLMPGQELIINAGVGAFSTEAKPQITIGGTSIPVNAEGIAEYKTAANSLGTHTVPVNIVYYDQEGKQQTISKTITYTVGQSNAAIALPEMNVMYVGIDNKVVISGSGVGAEKITARITQGNGSISGSNGNFIARVNAGSDVVVTAYADGKVIGSSQFRVRNVPRPQAIVGQFESGSRVSKSAFAVQGGVGAGIKDFPLNLQYTVVSFEVVADDPDGDVIPIQCEGNQFNQRARAAIQKVPAGGMVTIENIRCRYPDGTIKTLPPLLYTLN